MRSIRIRPALTLIELLVSVVLTLLVVFSVVQAFELLGNSITQGRAQIEMASQLRKAYFQLQRDLDSRTCPAEPWILPDSGSGYFEYLEGPNSDSSFASGPLGDTDDVLMFTIRSRGAPFRGRGPNNQIVESTLAEVIWWVARVDANNNETLDPSDPYVLMRRLLLIRPDIVLGPPFRSAAGRRIPFFREHDISARVELGPNNQPVMVANSLSDLSNRRNRFAHRIEIPGTDPVDVFPHIVLQSVSTSRYSTLEVQDRSDSENPGLLAWSFLPTFLAIKYQRPEDRDANWTGDLQDFASDWVALSDLQAFDIRAYDPRAPIYTSSSGVAVAPSDPGYQLKAQNHPQQTVIGYGAFADLGYFAWMEPQAPAWFSMAARQGTFLPPGQPGGVYDTWSLGYERDGLDQDRKNSVDQGTNGLDDNNNGLVDEPEERETHPPFESPLRGIEVRIRMIDPASRQVRQVSVVGDFVRE